jgi:ribosomal protein S21
MWKFLESRSNFKVKVTRSNIMVPIKRSCHKEYTYEIPITYRSKDMANAKDFFKSGLNFKVTRSNIMVRIKRSCRKEQTYEIWKPYTYYSKDMANV